MERSAAALLYGVWTARGGTVGFIVFRPKWFLTDGSVGSLRQAELFGHLFLKQAQFVHVQYLGRAVAHLPTLRHFVTASWVQVLANKQE